MYMYVCIYACRYVVCMCMYVVANLIILKHGSMTHKYICSVGFSVGNRFLRNENAFTHFRFFHYLNLACNLRGIWERVRMMDYDDNVFCVWKGVGSFNLPSLSIFANILSSSGFSMTTNPLRTKLFKSSPSRKNICWGKEKRKINKINSKTPSPLLWQGGIK